MLLNIVSCVWVWFGVCRCVCCAPVAILSAVFCVICVICILLVFVPDAIGDHMVKTYSSRGLIICREYRFY